MITETIGKCLDFFEIDGSYIQIDFKNYQALRRKDRGVYVLAHGDSVVYVGRGYIRDRQEKHWQKALNDLKPGTIDPKGWKWFRENHDVKPDEWQLWSISLARETELSAMEGSLIHLLQPLANDETFKDRGLMG